LRAEKGSFLVGNDSPVLSEVRDSTFWGKDMESKSFSEASKIDFKDSKPSQE